MLLQVTNTSITSISQIGLAVSAKLNCTPNIHIYNTRTSTSNATHLLCFYFISLRIFKVNKTNYYQFRISYLALDGWHITYYANRPKA